MKGDGTLDKIILDYTLEPGAVQKSVEFEKFEGADEIKIAITGDIPPIDYINADGKPAGFNTALLAEIGKRLKMNIKTVNVDTGARTAALTSGRVDVVFWYQMDYDDMKKDIHYDDVPDTTIFTIPYYQSYVI